MNFKRVHIIGGAGSGKTTLAQSYSGRFGTPHHELDNFYYLEPAARKRRPHLELLKHNRAYDRGPLRETLELASEFDEKLSICNTNSEAASILGLTSR